MDDKPSASLQSKEQFEAIVLRCRKQPHTKKAHECAACFFDGLEQIWFESKRQLVLFESKEQFQHWDAYPIWSSLELEFTLLFFLKDYDDDKKTFGTHCRQHCNVHKIPKSLRYHYNTHKLTNKPLDFFTAKDFRIIDYLGEGGCAKVYKAVHVSTGHVVALKACKYLYSSVENKEHAELPLNCGIVPCYGTFRAKVNDDLFGKWFVLKYCPQGDLYQRIQRDPLDEKEAARIIYGLVDTVIMLHGKGIAHHDIKPSNILFDESGSPLLCDLGISVKGFKGVNGGTLAYMAPEQLAELYGYVRRGEHPCDEIADVWSIGVCLYQILFQKLPFDKMFTVFECRKVNQNSVTSITENFDKLQVSDYEENRAMLLADSKAFNSKLDTPENAQDDLKDILRKLLTVDKKKRIRLALVKKHPWIKRQLFGSMSEK